MSTESKAKGSGREPRPEKVAAVAEIKGRLTESEVVVLSEYRGLSVSDLEELRTALRAAGGRYRIYKNSLARRAAAAAEVGDEFTELLDGPTALTYTDAPPDVTVDVVSIAKAMKDFSANHDELVIKGGLFEGRYIDPGEINRLAEVEPRDVLLSKLAGLIAAPMQQFAGLLQALPRDFAYGLKALIEKGGAEGAPASAAAVADEAPAVADEAPAVTEEAPSTDATDQAPTVAEEAPSTEVTEEVAQAPEPTTAEEPAPENEESE